MSYAPYQRRHTELDVVTSALSMEDVGRLLLPETGIHLERIIEALGRDRVWLSFIHIYLFNQLTGKHQYMHCKQVMPHSGP